jgi:hypothetical protein
LEGRQALVSVIGERAGLDRPLESRYNELEQTFGRQRSIA